MVQGVANVSSSESMKSCGKERVRDSRISDLEDKLAVAEDRCAVLRKQVAYMKMLYTSSNHQPTISEEDINNKETDNLRNSISNPMCYRAEVDSNYKTAPANMAMKSLNGTTLTDDPKEAMQLIVNEMTQSVNAMEGRVNIHSNTIEGISLISRNNKKRRSIKKDDWQVQKLKKTNPQPPTQRENPKTDKHKSLVKKKSLKSLGSRSRSVSRKLGKRPPPVKSSVGSTKPRNIANKETDVRAKEKPIKKEKVVKEPKNSEEKSVGMMPRVTSSTYLLPTLSYRMKCVPKSYRPQFSFHRIPFVLGKSTNKSHNIGAKIQETLSLIKLSRKGLQSASGQAKKEELTNILLPKTASEYPSPSIAEEASARIPGSQQNKQRSPMTVGATTDYKNYQLRTVLMNLHDEFSKMTENYEALKASLKEKYEPEVAQQAQNLEDELNAKEIEINAFMNLYNEVSQLKDRLSSTKVWPQPSSMYRPTSSSVAETTSSLKMTRLLRRIEQFQDQLKNMAYL
uniref:Centrosomal protein of 57 kDa n=1 Tax=Lygus hesperus TaxID=30085 RepID=A0A0A9XP50_LYGHE